jgi:UDPglucose 6-dehydrogenase
MKITIIGAGYVGLVSGACFAEFGVDVCMVDNAPEKIEALKRGTIPIYEPGLDKLVAENAAEGRLSFTTDIHEAVQGADAVFLAVGTPSRRGRRPCRPVLRLCRRRGGGARCHRAAGAGHQVHRAGRHRTRGEAARAGVRPDVADHRRLQPEFLREGAAIGDFMRPDRVVIGVEEARRASAPPTSCAACTARST